MICSWSRLVSGELALWGGGSSSDGGLAVFGSHARHVFQLTRVRHVVARLVLGQDFHQGAELQPPLVLGDPVTEEDNRKLEAVISHSQYFRCFVLLLAKMCTCGSKLKLSLQHSSCISGFLSSAHKLVSSS